jgi:hypothetical protein
MSAKPWLSWPQARARCGKQQVVYDKHARRLGEPAICTARLIHPDGGWIAESKLTAIHRLHPDASWTVEVVDCRPLIRIRWKTGQLRLLGTNCRPEAPIERKPRQKATIEPDAEDDNDLPCGVAA